MAKEQYLDLAGLTTYDEEIKSHIETVADEKADIQHNHTVSEITDLLDLTEEEIAELCEFDGNPDNIIPIASKASMGCVVAGDGLDIDDNGVLSVQSLTDEEIESICEFDEGMTEDNVIPKATKTALGCIKVGDGLAIDSAGRLSATGGGSGVATAGIGSAGMKLLWENPDPTAAFAAQAIELDLSQYSNLMIVFRISTTFATYDSVFTSVGTKFVMDSEYAHDTGNVGRYGTSSETGISFEGGYLKAAVNNSYAIPYQIYGVDVAPPNVDYTLTEEKTIQELLWTNPNPTAEFAAQTINLDLSEYDKFLIVGSGYHQGASMAEYKIKKPYLLTKESTRWVLEGINLSSDGAYIAMPYRYIEITDSKISFGEGAYKSTNGSNINISNVYAIPLEIYGIKNKINVTTAVVTDKGQHTDLLWENANPNSSFAAQTIELDLNGYNEVEIVYKVDNGTTAEQQSMTAVVGRTCRLDAIGQSSGKPHVSKRNATINETSIVFEGSSYVTASTSDWVSSTVHVIPVEIYGIKHNAATTSTIMGDYIVEEGTVTMEDGTIWNYIKRSSGYMELKGMRNGIITPSEFGTWGNYMYIAPITSRPFPFAFTELWDSKCHVWTTDGMWTMMTGDIYNSGQQPTNTMTGQFVAVRTSAPSSNANVRIFFEAFGRWK